MGLNNALCFSRLAGITLWLIILQICIIYAVAGVDLLANEDNRMAVQAGPNLIPSEMQALHDLYTSTNGPKWKYRPATLFNNKWNFTPTANPCTQHWQGVTCTLVPPHYYVRRLNLLSFNMRGQLPNTMPLFTKIIFISLTFNRLNGTIPASMGNITSLEYLDLSSNYLTGTIPSSFGNIPVLQDFDVSDNLLTGHIPHSLTKIPDLFLLDIGLNFLDGPIPCYLAQMGRLVTLHLYGNAFTGNIPDCVCNFTAIQQFDVSHNMLTGTIPAAVGNMTTLVHLYAFENAFTGTLPRSIGYLTALENLEVYSNSLSGVLPSAIGNLRTMQLLALYNNSFTGTIPNSIQNMTQLQYLYIDTNHFTGTVPACIGNMSTLVLLDVHDNHFHGSLPAFVVGNHTFLQFIAVYDNMLTGTIPVSVTNLTLLREFQVQDNQLSGSMQDLFRADVHTLLTTIQVNNNQLTGELPTELFELPQLHIFAALSNCFEGQLPPSVCNNSNLVSLVLDGLSSAKTCRNALLPSISRSYVTHDPVYGTIPQCLFTHPTLTTLHLSGNGFTGTLPDNIKLGPSLIDLTLSHNLLTGSIPPNFQVREWFNLDLSYNKLGGTLLKNLSSSHLNASSFDAYEASLGVNVSTVIVAPTLLLENNRLSGHIPGAVREELNISILGTNVFSCRLDRSDLPTHDSGKVNYQCGSDSFDVPYYVWLAMSVAVICIVLLLWARPTVTGAEQSFFHTVLQCVQYDVQKTNIATVQRVLSLFQDISLGSTVYILLVLLPMCCLLTHYYGTLTYQYAWGVSAAYLSGEVPAAWEFALFAVLLCIVLAIFQRSCTTSVIAPDSSTRSAGSSTVSEIRASNQSVSAPRSVAIYAIFIIINLTVVIGVNSAYVYVAIYQGNKLFLLAQILISLFKIAWNNVCSAYILRKLVIHLHAEARLSDSDAQDLSLQVFVALLNNIVIPCLVVAVISPDCFYNVFDAAPAVTSEFSFPTCVIDDSFACVAETPVLVTTSYDPPFRYTYQCSSSFITYYAPAFVILCLVVTFVNPTLQLLVFHCHGHAKADSVWFRVLDTVLPRILKPINADPTTLEVAHTGVYFDANRVLIIALTFLGLLLTFGAVFPPLAVAICLTVLSVVYWAKYKLGRFLSAAQEQQLHQYVEVIERECAQVGSSAVLHNSMWMLITISCWFYTLFLFDTLGDAVGFDDALWVLVVMPLMPLVLYSIHALLVKFLPLNGVQLSGTNSLAEPRESELTGISHSDGTSKILSVDMDHTTTTLNILQKNV